MAHIRAQFKTSNETYGSPSMHVELNEDGLNFGRHHFTRFMRDNNLKAMQKRRYKKTTDSNHGGLGATKSSRSEFHLRWALSKMGC